MHEAVLVNDNVDEATVHDSGAGGTHALSEEGAHGTSRAAGEVRTLSRHGARALHMLAGVATSVAHVLREAHFD